VLFIIVSISKFESNILSLYGKWYYFHFDVCTSELYINAFYDNIDKEKYFKNSWNESEETMYGIIFLGVFFVPWLSTIFSVEYSYFDDDTINWLRRNTCMRREKNEWQQQKQIEISRKNSNIVYK